MGEDPRGGAGTADSRRSANNRVVVCRWRQERYVCRRFSIQVGRFGWKRGRRPRRSYGRGNNAEAVEAGKDAI